MLALRKSTRNESSAAGCYSLEIELMCCSDSLLRFEAFKGITVTRDKRMVIGGVAGCYE